MHSDIPQKAEGSGVPAWVVTFADLMTLLMCFFVLLLAFSEMDLSRFKLLSGSMKEAFGVQAEVEARTMPKGTSLIAQEFSPGRPEPTPLNVVQQHTIDSNRNSLDALHEEPKEIEEARRHALRIRRALQDEIDRGYLSVELDGARIIIHIQEKASFDSGSADLRPQFRPIIAKIAGLVGSDDGLVSVSGHTDNVPIANERFRSNWELSTSRAVSVTHELIAAAALDPSSLMVVGHADTRPVTSNATPEDRARNRRVDISITRGIADDTNEQMTINETGDTPPTGDQR